MIFETALLYLAYSPGNNRSSSDVVTCDVSSLSCLSTSVKATGCKEAQRQDRFFLHCTHSFYGPKGSNGHKQTGEDLIVEHVIAVGQLLYIIKFLTPHKTDHNSEHLVVFTTWCRIKYLPLINNRLITGMEPHSYKILSWSLTLSAEACVRVVKDLLWVSQCKALQIC